MTRAEKPLGRFGTDAVEKPSESAGPPFALSLVGCAVRVDACGGVARAVLTQKFVNPHAEPLVVTYRFPIPPDAALSGYGFSIGPNRVIGRVEPRAAAREHLEAAMLEGRPAALLDEEDASAFSLELGPILPGAELVAELRLDQKLAWCADASTDGSWEWRFPTTATPRYVGARGSNPLQPAVETSPPRVLEVAMVVRDVLAAARTPESPSHPLACSTDRNGVHVALAAGRVALDRDVVVRWPVTRPKVSVAVDRGRPARADGSAYGLVTIVPASAEAMIEAMPRDVIVLIDTSGSMAGKPLEQAQRVVLALIAGLGERDNLELVEFASAPRRWRPEATCMTDAAREEARAWIRELIAGGGTEMKDGILDALRTARAEAQRQVVVVTDGAIAFERELVAAIATKLPPTVRLHVVGVGPAVNRALTEGAARVGRGAELLLGLGEDAERAAALLLARTTRPLVVDLVVDGSAVEACAPARPPDLFAGAPALISAKLRPDGGELRVAGRTVKGPWQERIVIPPTGSGTGSQAVVARFGRAAVEDLEMEIAAGANARSAELRIEQLGLEFQLATRFTSWVAIRENAASGAAPGAEPSADGRRELIALPLPFGVSAEALGLRSPGLPRLVSSMPPSGEEEKTQVTKVIQPTPLHGVRPGTTDCLVVIYTKEPALLGKRFVLESDPTRIGRGVTSEILLDGDSVSRRHAQIERSRDTWLIGDGGSTNGTYVNDEQISRQVALRNGDRVKIGATIFKFLSGEDVEAQYHEEIYRMTIVDGLTQIYNKRYLHESLEREIVRSRRHERELAVLMLDIDHFKRINDEHGHLAGDFVLKEMARLIQTRIRRDEVFARYGGEEFSVILPETPLEGAASLAEMIREKVAEREFVFHEDTIRVTVSIGGAALREEDRFAADLLKRADERLYAAKNGGRNRVRI